MADLANVQGLSDLLKYFAQSPVNMHIGVRAGLYAGALLIEAEAKTRCPTDTGALRSTIHATITEVDKKIVATIRAGNDIVTYAPIIEFSGARAHIERNVGFGGHDYNQVHHPGMKAHPFLRPALHAQELPAIAEVDKQVEQALK